MADTIKLDEAASAPNQRAPHRRADTERPDDERPDTANRAPKSMKAKIVGGSLTLLAGSGFVGLTNLVYNVLTARLLGPTGFAHATAVYTILMLASCITLSFQVVSAKYIARSASDDERATVFASLHRRAWIAGVSIGVILFVFERPLTNFLNLPDPVLISLLALGTAFYVPLGVRRGYIQGIHSFRPLAINFMMEGLVRLGCLCALIALGMGVRGAVLASVLAVIVCYFFALPSPGLTSLRVHGIAISFREGLQAIVFFSGQTIINNFDIVLVKHFFPPAAAGFYAAVALVGRLVNMCAWSVVNTMFPVSAAANSDEPEARPVLFTSLAMVLGILGVLIFGMWMIPSFLWKMLFGSQFEISGYGALAPLLILYAVTTGIYSLSSVIITHEMSRKIANTSWLQLAFSFALAAGVYLIHDTLRHVIQVQLVLMIVLLVLLMIPLLRPQVTPKVFGRYRTLRLRRPFREEEVMSEFLRSEFHHKEFDNYREQFADLVRNPDLTSPTQNSVRQALLFLRRGAMWRELPADTKWFEVELIPEDVARVRFFPRAQWRRVADGSFYMHDVIKRIRLKLDNSEQGDFFNKLRRLTNSIEDDGVSRTILLIGADENAPLTILDGNHRMAAAMLNQSPAHWDQFRFVCGLSPEMIRCCWYQTSFSTLLRYFKNLVYYFSYDPDSDIGRYQEHGASPGNSSDSFS
jgi:O-antigen/teichoic acid export membrane protein